MKLRLRILTTPEHIGQLAMELRYHFHITHALPIREGTSMWVETIIDIDSFSEEQQAFLAQHRYDLASEEELDKIDEAN